MRRLKSSWIVWLGFCLGLSGTGQGQQFQEWSFQAPAGWQMTQESGAAMLAPPEARPGTVYIRLFAGQKMTGDLSAWMEDRVLQDTQGTTLLRKSPAAPLQTSGPGVMQKLVAVQWNNGQKAVRMYIGQSPTPGVGELMVFQAELSVASRYTPILNGFVDSVRFSNASPGDQTSPAPPAEITPPPAQQETSSLGRAGLVNGGTALEGWYAKSTTQVMPGVNFTTSVKTVWKFYRFFPNGWVYTSLPKQGDLNTVQCPQAGTGEGRCEQYAIRGRMITIGRDGPKSLEPVPGPDGEIRVSGVGMWPLRPLPNSPSGTYEAVSGSGMMGTMSLRVRDMTFLPGGRFTSSQSTAVSSNTANTAAGAYRNGGSSGQFRVSGYDLELQFANGTRASTKIVAPTQDMDMLLIGETVYIRKGAR